MNSEIGFYWWNYWLVTLHVINGRSLISRHLETLPTWYKGSCKSSGLNPKSSGLCWRLIPTWFCAALRSTWSCLRLTVRVTEFCSGTLLCVLWETACKGLVRALERSELGLSVDGIGCLNYFCAWVLICVQLKMPVCVAVCFFIQTCWPACRGVAHLDLP